MAVGHGGLYHSQSPEGFFQQASGLKVSLFSLAEKARQMRCAEENCVTYIGSEVIIG
jgi:pyruvate/2-oxoglutarate/acetoin dehydrogenase E1 component